MNSVSKFLWLNGIFDEKTINSFLTINPAINFWQKGFVYALKNLDNPVEVVGYPVERVWPFGRLIVKQNQAALLDGMRGSIIGYPNILFLRDMFQYYNLRGSIKKHYLSSKDKPTYQIVISCLNNVSDESSSIRTAKYIRKKYNIPWICIVADGVTPLGADGYVYLSWSQYELNKDRWPSIHIDGGIPTIKNIDSHNAYKEKILMYMGDLRQHGGALELAQAFNKIENNDIKLWICGRGENIGLQNLAKIDSRIHLKGFVNDEELNELASMAFAFANPRPNAYAPNKLNYPSKILHYLSYQKPIISTISNGFSPDLQDILIPIENESEIGLSNAIRNIFNLQARDYEHIQCCIRNFSTSHSWEYQVKKFLLWIESSVGIHDMIA